MVVMRCEEKPATKPLPDVAQIIGGNTVSGLVEVSGFKIAAIPIIAATILTEGTVELINLPLIEDVEVLLHLIQLMGGEVQREGRLTRVGTASLRPIDSLPSELITSVHGTLYLLPVLLARFGRVRITRTYGGCSIGERPIAHIVSVMEKMGAHVDFQGEDIVAEAQNLHGTFLSAQYSLEWDKFRSGATKTALLLGVCAQGTTVVQDAYRRASITELVAFLRCLGADISGEGTSRLVIHGGRSPHGGRFELAGDYLEALTYISLAAICRGKVEVSGFNPEHCRAELDLFKRMGLELEEFEIGVRAFGSERLRAASFTTMEIDTDIQPVMAAALALAEGQSVVEEKVWENRFGYAAQLNLMGAATRKNGNRLIIDGVMGLRGANLEALDLRGAAALLLASAAAEGRSTVSGLGHLGRGYHNLMGKMRGLGVNIEA